MADILEIKSVSKTYNADSDNPVKALNSVDLNVAEGEFVSIIGPSGCGKSTLFNVIGGLIDDHEGEVLIEGRPVDGAHKDVGVVFQEESTFPWRTTLDNVAFPLRQRKMDEGVIRERVMDSLESVGLTGFEGRKIQALSGGQQQRVALARSLAKQAGILLLDEPLVNLDYKLREQLREEFRNIFSDQVSSNSILIYSSTDPLEAMQLGGDIIVLDEGRVLQQGAGTRDLREPGKHPRRRNIERSGDEPSPRRH